MGAPPKLADIRPAYRQCPLSHTDPYPCPFKAGCGPMSSNSTASGSDPDWVSLVRSDDMPQRTPSSVVVKTAKVIPFGCHGVSGTPWPHVWRASRRELVRRRDIPCWARDINIWGLLQKTTNFNSISVFIRNSGIHVSIDVHKSRRRQRRSYGKATAVACHKAGGRPPILFFFPQILKKKTT